MNILRLIKGSRNLRVYINILINTKKKNRVAYIIYITHMKIYYTGEFNLHS